MNPNTGLFQKKALDRLRKPKDFGHVFSITSSIGWLLLAAVMVSLFSILIWAVFGTMTDKVNGYGMILQEGGIVNIAPTGSGRIVSLQTSPGQHVNKGDVVAVIEQSDLEQQIYQEKDQAQDAASHREMQSKTTALSSAKELYHQKANVVSQYSGTVIDRRKREGEIIQAGTPLYDLDPDQANHELIAVVFVPALQGDRIKPGMSIHVSPGAVDESLYGSLVGRVLSVSEYPSTSDRVLYWTGNKEFSSWVVQQCGGAILEVQVELIKDTDTSSGYLWTSILGPEEPIRQGMTCTASAVVTRQAPLVKAFDKLSQWIRSD